MAMREPAVDGVVEAGTSRTHASGLFKDAIPSAQPLSPPRDEALEITPRTMSAVGFASGLVVLAELAAFQSFRYCASSPFIAVKLLRFPQYFPFVSGTLATPLLTAYLIPPTVEVDERGPVNWPPTFATGSTRDKLFNPACRVLLSVLVRVAPIGTTRTRNALVRCSTVALMVLPAAVEKVSGVAQVVQLIVAVKVAVNRDVGVEETRSGPGITNLGSPVESGAGADE
jgi:hypothetical protein